MRLPLSIMPLMALLVVSPAWSALCQDGDIEKGRLGDRAQALFWHPSVPTERDSFSVSASTQYGGCGSLESGEVSLLGSEIVAEFVFGSATAGTICYGIVLTVEVTDCLAPLPSGEYSLSRRVVLPRSEGLDTTEYSQTFVVRAENHDSEWLDFAWNGPRDVRQKITGNVTPAVTRDFSVVARKARQLPRSIVLRLSTGLFFHRASVSGGDTVLIDISENTARGGAEQETMVDSGDVIANGLIGASSEFAGRSELTIRWSDGGTSGQETILAVAVPFGDQGKFDANWDHLVGLDDFFLFSDAFGTSRMSFDGDGSGEVDFSDFLEFADHYGRRY
jgi:hypothetical protein